MTLWHNIKFQIHFQKFYGVVSSIQVVADKQFKFKVKAAEGRDGKEIFEMKIWKHSIQAFEIFEGEGQENMQFLFNPTKSGI